MRRLLVYVAVALVGASACVGIAQAAGCKMTANVTDGGDSGDKGQLRSAIANVCDGGEIHIRSGTVIALQDGGLEIPSGKTLTIVNPSHGKTQGAVIDGRGANRVLFVDEGANLTLEGLIIQGGSGGGIALRGANLTLIDSTITENGGSSSLGGGIVMDVSPDVAPDDQALTLIDSTVIQNTADLGGGIYIEGGVCCVGPVNLYGDSSITENSANSAGGIFDIEGFNNITLHDRSTISRNEGVGIAVFRVASLTLNDTSSISGNDGSGALLFVATAELNDDSAINGNGGAGISGSSSWSVILNDRSAITGNAGSGIGGGGSLGSVTMNDSSSISGNDAQQGGGILNYLSSVTMNDNSTISGNVADDGGGIYSVGEPTEPTPGRGAVTLNDSSSITGNTASGHGGGIYNSNGSVTLNDGSSISGNIPDDCFLC